MPKTIRTKDGIVINNVPDDVDPNGPEVRQRVAELRAQRDGSASPQNPQPSAPPIMRSGDVQPLQNGMPMDQATHQRQDFRELPPAFRNMSPEQALEAARGGGELRLRNADPNAQLSQDRYGNPTMTMNGQQYYFNKPGINTSDIRQGAERVLEGAADVAPYLSTGVGTAAMRALPAMAAQAVTGIMAEGTNQAMEAMNGGEFDWREVGKMSLTAAAGEGIGRAIVGVLGGILGRFAGRSINVTNADGTLTDDAIRILRENNVNPAQLDDAVRQNLVQNEIITPEQAERWNLFKRYNMTPLRAQVTRTADDFQQQQELLKRSGSVRNAVETQRGQMDDIITGMAERNGAAGTSVYDAISYKALQLDEQIGALYKQADDVAAQSGQGVRLSNYVSNLRRAQYDDQMAGGLIESLKGDLINKGIIDESWRLQGRVSPREAERVRQFMNKRYKETTNATARGYIQELKEYLDEDVFSFAGDDIYRQARQAKADFEAGLRRSANNKFDQYSRSLVRDILENKVNNPDKVVDDLILRSTNRPDDIAELRNYLLSGSDEQIAIGRDAWETIRRDTLTWVRNQAFKSRATGEQGLSEFSADKFNGALQRIGFNKMKELFSEEELRVLDDLRKIADARTPIDSTFQGLGPTGQAFKALQEKLAKMASRDNSNLMINMANWLLDQVTAGQYVRPNIPGAVERAITPANQGLRSIGAPAAVQYGDEAYRYAENRMR